MQILVILGMSLIATDFQGSLPYPGGQAGSSGAAYRWSYNTTGTGQITAERTGKFLRVDCPISRLTTVGDFATTIRSGVGTITFGLVSHSLWIISAENQNSTTLLFYCLIQGTEFTT